MSSFNSNLTVAQCLTSKNLVQVIAFEQLEEKQKGLFSQNVKHSLKLSLHASWFTTPLGPMFAVGDDQYLYLLEFEGRKGLEEECKELQEKWKALILPGFSKTLLSIKEELERYFAGKLKVFETPIAFLGSSFQKVVWQELRKIPHGETRSYSAIAKAISNPKAVRAVARANAANRLAIIIPCHRVILADGHLGGYGGGADCKKKLLTLEGAL